MKRIALIYNADWSVQGGLNYLWDSLKGKQVCSLCDITHGGVTEKKEWKSCSLSSNVPLELFYKNQLVDGMKEAANGDYPCVLSENQEGKFEKILSSQELNACAGSVELLQNKLTTILQEKAPEVSLFG